MAAKNFFVSFRLLKRLHRTPKWISENNTNRLTAFTFERGGMKSAHPCVYHVNSAVSSRNDSVIRVSDCYAEENCKNNFTFLPFTILLLSVLNSTAAYRDETEEKSENVYAQWTNVWSLNYWCGYWSVAYLLNCCVVIELTLRKTELLNPYTGLFWYMATMPFP